MTDYEIKYMKENTNVLSLVINFFEFINKEINDIKEKSS